MGGVGRLKMANLEVLLSVSATTTEPMPTAPDVIPAHANAREEADALVVELSGNWRITGRRPEWREVVGKRVPKAVRLETGGLGNWDSSLLLFWGSVRRWCDGKSVRLDDRAMPEQAVRLMDQLAVTGVTQPAVDRAPGLFTAVGLCVAELKQKTKDIAHFVGECTLSAIAVAKRPHKFRWTDCLAEMQQCGALALPIVGLINFLVGVTLAYIGAIVLRQYGGDIYVADFVGLSMVREMAAMMTGIVMAGRTGAAFAAQLGNMKANEEIDAIQTLGLKPIEFLVLPRLIALTVMMPLLTMYASALGILGGVVISMVILSISPAAYWVETLTIVDMSDVMTGVIKATTFGVIVGLAGCLRGLQADRNAAGVGKAATSAVVTSILLIIVADAIYAAVFNILGW
jgi:phospholipid/cholesterol/gamma-HCH transport system permease protein